MNAADEILKPALERGYGPRPALLFGDKAVSYDALAAGVNRAGNAFRALGIEPEERVLMLVGDSPSFVYCYLGIMKIGAVAVAINLRSAPRDLLFFLHDSRAKLLIIECSLIDTYRQIADELEKPPIVLVVGEDVPGFSSLASLVARQSERLDTADLSRDDMAFWLYTSGTTGRAKAAVHVQKDVLNAEDYLGGALGVRHGDRIYATSKLFFAYALGNVLFGSLRLGATSILLHDWPNPEPVARVIAQLRPTVVLSVPTLYRNLLASGVASGEGFKAVRHYVSAGERLPESLWQRWHLATGVEILDGMGTSETVYMLLTNYPGAARPGSSGQPVPRVDARLADADGNPTPAGEGGILWARSPSRADRYWNQQEKSQDAFRGAWFRTGDIYRIDEDGYWFHEGRHDDLLKVSGQWVSPVEIEELVMAELPVRDAIVVGTRGEADLMRLTLFVVGPEEAFDLSSLERQIRMLVTERLSVYKCPKWVRFVDMIPRTATGKAQRFALRHRAEELLKEETAL